MQAAITLFKWSEGGFALEPWGIALFFTVVILYLSGKYGKDL